MKNTQEQAFRIVQEIIKHSPDWDCMKIIVDGKNQNKKTIVKIG
jgi:hypothetical protein